jgi:DNA-binding GntR family transcriptional regulator
MSFDARAGGRLENITLWERVHHHLREDILANRLPPGTVLGEVALAESLGVSRGPVREALGRLAAEGLVTIRPRRGAVVSALSAEEFLDAYQVREALESLAIRLATGRLSEAQIERLQTLVDEQARHAARGDVEAFFQANATFHSVIVDAAENETLKEMYRQLMGHMGRYRMRSLALRGTLKRSVGEHRAILRAVRARDAEAATRLLANHIRVPQERLATQPEREVVLTR